MASIDLTGKDPFAPYMPNTNRMLNADIGSAASPASLLSSLVPALGSLFGSGKSQSSSSTSVASGFSGIGNFSPINSGPYPNSNSLDQTLNTVISMAAVGLFLVVLLKVAK